jgi:hypothetical protein
LSLGSGHELSGREKPGIRLKILLEEEESLNVNKSTANKKPEKGMTIL